jgi:opacity protein-like surface antigen
MNTRLASVAAALAIGLAAPASAFAQTYIAPGGVPVVAVEAGPGWQPRAPIGVIASDLRGYDSSAKGGNASQPERAVPQYGTTSGGPAY